MALDQGEQFGVKSQDLLLCGVEIAALAAQMSQQLLDALQGIAIPAVGVGMHAVGEVVETFALKAVKVPVGAFAEHRQHPMESDLGVVVAGGDGFADEFSGVERDAVVEESETKLELFLG
jgi:hypothetical protein